MELSIIFNRSAHSAGPKVLVVFLGLCIGGILFFLFCESGFDCGLIVSLVVVVLCLELCFVSVRMSRIRFCFVARSCVWFVHGSYVAMVSRTCSCVLIVSWLCLDFCIKCVHFFFDCRLGLCLYGRMQVRRQGRLLAWYCTM